MQRKIKKRRISKGTIFLNVIFSFVFVFLFFLFLFVPKVYLKGDYIVNINVGSVYHDKGVKTLKKIKTINEVDTSKIGSYEVKYIYRDNLFKYNFSRIVNVKDLEKPKIVLEGEDVEYYCPNGKYQEKGFKAYDNVDLDITDKVKIKHKKDSITYEVEDSSGNRTKIIRKLREEDVEAPSISLNGDDNVFISLNESYNDTGVLVTDNCEGDLSSKVKVTNEVDTTKIGDYKVIYEVEDSSNNKSKIERNIKVREPLKANTIYLTFDDGPRDGTTDKILDILKEKDVKATFFVTNNGSDLLIKRIVTEGHSIGIHTASHKYDIIYASAENYFNDLELVQKRIYDNTGVATKLIRFPGGSSNTISKKYSEGIMSTLTRETLDKGYQYYDWNIDSGDSSFATNSHKLYNSVINSLSHDKYNVILMHDTKTYTRDALSKIIDYAKSEGYSFDVLDINKMPLRQKVNN